MKILFLYTELADYTVACLKALKRANGNFQLYIVHFPVNPEAPFTFDFANIGRFRCVSEFSDYNAFKYELDSYAPDKIVCSGWVNRWYIRYCRQQRNKSQSILLVDNTWSGSLKQQLLRVIFRAALRGIFDKIWIPGNPQLTFAENIGFTSRQILTGYYCCDTTKFNALFEQNKEFKKNRFPHRFLCVARYIPEKNYENLWQAFIEWKEKNDNDWELWCAGTGAQFEQKMNHPYIKHLGFVQKDEWNSVLTDTGVFVLASIYEPWGVVVHEFAAAGYPLIVSSTVGSASVFLTEKNGFLVNPFDKVELKKRFDLISKMPDEQLFGMGLESYELSKRITPEHWTQTLLNA